MSRRTVLITGASSGIGREFAKQLAAKSKSKVVISFGSPYMLREFMDADYVVAAYDPCEAMQRAAVRALFGEIFFRGELPVRI